MRKNISTSTVKSIPFILFAISNSVSATEGGNSIYPLGAENFSCCALPPPGVYGMVLTQHYSADKVRGNSGEVVTPSSFKVAANAVVPRVVWVTPYTVGDSSIALHAILPLVDLDVDIAPGVAQSKKGVGDMTLGLAFGNHHNANLHTVFAVDVYLPTGKYKEADIANIGRNYWATQLVAGVSYINHTGINADLKAMWTYNFENNDTHYHSGQEIIMDYDLGWAFGNGWTAGVGGYLYQQITDDVQNGNTVSNNRSRAIAFGPSVRYDGGKGWFLTAKYQVESNVRNHSDGAAFWGKAVFPF
ncbi:transporter [Neptunomonas sp.]